LSGTTTARFRRADACRRTAPRLRRMDSQPDEGRRALAFMNRLDEAVASEVREWRLGTALVTPELPRVWDASYFRVERPDDDAERVAAETVEIAGAAGLAHCAVVLTDDEIADELARAWRAPASRRCVTR